MATKSITASSDILQEISDSPRESTVINQGQEQLVSGVLDYLGNASFDSLSAFDLRQTAEAAGIRKAVADLLEGWLDALALRRFTHWQMSRPLAPRVVNRYQAPEVPADTTELDPFLRNAIESGAIRRAQPSWKAARWPTHYKLYGCLCCQTKESPENASTGLCHRCYMRVSQRLKRIEEDLHTEFQERER